MNKKSITIFFFLAFLSVAYTLSGDSPDREILARWYNPEKPESWIEFMPNGLYRMNIHIPFGVLSSMGEYETDTSVTPHRLNFYTAQIYLDGQIPRSSMFGQAGSEYYAIYSVEEQQINGQRRTVFVYQMNRTAFGERPSEFDDPVIYVRD